ncbi:hypothetical protein HC02_28725, partial [Vibrio parahaemolyticus]
MVTVDKQDSVTLKISHALAESKSVDLDIYFFVPGELGLNADIISESEFYYTSITQQRAYYSTEILLPLVL